MATKAAIDNSPLQALWRAGILGKLPDLFKSILVPQSVADETRWSLALIGPERVPNLKEHRWIHIESVQEAVLRASMVPLFKSFQRRRRGAKADTRRPEVALKDGRVIAWTEPNHEQNQLTHKIPDLEVVLLAQSASGIAILDDRKALRAAEDLGIRTATTREVVDAMAKRGLIADAETAIKKMKATNYHPYVRVTNAWDGTS